ncbi:hypothetical protein AYI68_g5721 [Smittium mucronatum]|uniref:Uncharacterized protein n=1 Tax=Smittium mucronatum TaxID=133383 RepID=A0A1R0GTG8_9FUNG|nr:hypothetical protein AYI68_g5721 [Smittium mucronatum]
MQEINQILVEWKGLLAPCPSLLTISQSAYRYQGATTDTEIGSMNAHKLKGNAVKSATIQGQRFTQGIQKTSENWEGNCENPGELHREVS